MISLIIDTSSDNNFALLCYGETPWHEIELPSGRDQSKHLLNAIQSLLTKANISLTDLNYIGVAVGPGTFTGTRIGVITAKTLAFAAHLPIVGFCSLKRYVPTNDGPFTIQRDAKSKGYYAISGEKTGATIHYTKKPFLTSTPIECAHQSSYHHLVKLVQKKFSSGQIETATSLTASYL